MMQGDVTANNTKQNLPGPPISLEVFQRFIHKAASGSMPLFSAAVLALVWANISPQSYHDFWSTNTTLEIGNWQISKSAAHWTNEALMTLFFLTVGMEIKREILVGELASFKMAMLPVAAALGGMLLPACIYALFNHNEPSIKGWGIPMATDIAFSLAVLAILGKRAPVGLRIFLSALAIADDLGAVLVIAIFYTASLSISHLIVGLGFIVCLYVANRLWVRNALVYIVLGVGVWLAIMGSGVHATVAGAIVAMFIPAQGRYDTDTFIRTAKEKLNRFECIKTTCKRTMLLDQNHLESVLDIEMACHNVETPLQRMEYSLHSWVAYLILPLFALANTGLVFKDIDLAAALTQPVTLGVTLGLVLGKPIGIFLFTLLAVKVLKAHLPSGVEWKHIVGVSMLGGIGFTMSLFITGLSFSRPELTSYSKLGIVTGSLVSAAGGLAVLMLTSKKTEA
ncbi:MAG: Na+/H+ antiporter NhaA [Desulfatibacillum sp.]|nr:Na+/H+ antiporter NhaA [Desulfatibacillum sp.]